MLAAKNFQSGLTMLRQLEFALFDMELHQRTEFGPDTVQQVLDSVRARVTVLTPPAFNHQHQVSRIFCGRVCGRLLQLQMGGSAVGGCFFAL